MDAAHLALPGPGNETLSPLAAALGRASGAVLDEWERRVRRDMPRVAHNLTASDLRANLPEFLDDLAAVVAGAARDKLTDEEGPARGVRRFNQHFELRHVLASERHLWAAIVWAVPASLARAMSVQELLRLRDGFDDFMDASLLAYAHCQEADARADADAELKRLAFLSHDLNNALNETSLGLELLRHRLEGSAVFNGEAVFVRHVEQSVADTMHGMRQLLQHERLRKAGVRPALQPVNVAALASRVTQQFAARLEAKGLALEIQTPPDAVVESDPDLLAVVLRNLVGNAVKYSQRGTIRVRLEPRSGGNACRGDGCRGHACGGDGCGGGARVLSVSDEGRGIDPECLKDIFEAFRRGTTAKSPAAGTGTGLGLAIAREAAKALGAELTADSRVGVGSTFRLHFDAPACHAAAGTGTGTGTGDNPLAPLGPSRARG